LCNNFLPDLQNL